MRDGAELIAQLQLQAHPEGGHYRETFRAQAQVATPRGHRAASTAILFLLQAGERSHWHRIASDETWFFHGGGPLLVHQLSAAGTAITTTLGLALSQGQTPQHTVAAGDWFAAEPAPGSPWCLVSCSVAPGFDFVDFELAAVEQLAEHSATLSQLCGNWERFCITP